ncbi:protein ROOT INITIATION DEFECTIVE 3-like [Musa acuminata AAA Group]|uniref:protein ROOT INITIATION DEFECTIVE 3-like n=1 Tax=Musa acuminata AAA Group TaxID=214697 RepID=UPI0031D8229F
MEVVIASSPVDVGFGCWDLRSGFEQLRYRSCSSAPHGLLSIAGRFLASSQLRDSPSSASCPIFFWSWDKPQVEVRSFPVESIGPLVSNSEGTYVMGGGPSGIIYQWEVASGKLLTWWHAHYRSVTCLTLSKDESLLISGSEDGSVRV